MRVSRANNVLGKRKLEEPDNNPAPLQKKKRGNFLYYDMSPIVSGLGEYTGKINTLDIEPLQNLSYGTLKRNAQKSNKLFILAICQVLKGGMTTYQHYDANAFNTQYQKNVKDPKSEGKILAIHYYSLNKIEKASNQSSSKEKKLHFTYRGQQSCENDDNSKKFINAYVKALQGSMQSQYEIGEYFEKGLSGTIPKNENKAFEWFQASGIQGHGQSQANLGKYYLNGIGTEKNYNKAVEWYQKAAHQGIASAQYSMSTYYINRDPKKALELMEKSANQGFFLAISAILTTWIDDSTAKGDKTEAVKRINKACIDKSRELNLSNLSLNKLPTCLGYLSNTETLDLADNEFCSLPIAVDQFLNLKQLYLSNNKISSLPTDIHQLSQLELLDLEDNSDLAELPTSLGRISTLEDIDIEGTKIPFQVLWAILSTCKSTRDELDRVTFTNHLGPWLALNGLEIDSEESKNFIKNFENKEKESLFSHTEIGTLRVWLWRLEETKDYQGCQKKLASIVYEILQNLISNKTFKELFFDQAEANNVDCQDRAAMALNELYTTLRITQLSDETLIKDELTEEAKTLALHQLLKDKVCLMCKVSKTLALRRLLGKKIDEWEKQNKRLQEEDVEIYLHYETLLREELGLMTAIEESTYDGQRKWIDSKALAKEVNDSYLDDLVNVPIFEKLIEKEESFIKLWSEKKKEYEADQNVLEQFTDNDIVKDEEFKKSWMTTARKYSTNTNYNDCCFKESLENLQKKQKKAKANIMKKWVQDILNEK